MSFDSVKDLLPNNLTQQQVLTKFGMPSEKEQQGGTERWRYIDPVSHSQRIHFVFRNSVLVQMFWYPLPGEKEMRIETIFARYPKDKFKQVNTQKDASDSLDSETSYANESNMSILHDDSRKQVSAVVWYSPMPSGLSQKNPLTSR